MLQQLKFAIQELLHENNWETRDSRYSTKQFVVWRKSPDTICNDLDTGIGNIIIYEDYFTFQSGIACPPKRSNYLYCDPNSLDFLLDDLNEQWQHQLYIIRIFKQIRANDYISLNG